VKGVVCAEIGDEMPDRVTLMEVGWLGEWRQDFAWPENDDGKG
jgi:hypothetical protein